MDYDLRGAWLTLPRFITPVKRHGPDFDTFSFLDGKKKQVLFVYVGYAPRFPSDSAPKSARRGAGKIHGLAFQEVRWQDGKHACREVLVKLDPRLAAHCLYSVSGQQDAALADALIASLRRKR